MVELEKEPLKRIEAGHKLKGIFFHCTLIHFQNERIFSGYDDDSQQRFPEYPRSPQAREERDNILHCRLVWQPRLDLEETSAMYTDLFFNERKIVVYNKDEDFEDIVIDYDNPDLKEEIGEAMYQIITFPGWKKR